MTRQLPPWLCRPESPYARAYPQRFRYHLALALATPPWLSKHHRARMRGLYRYAARHGKQVDHIVPLNSPLVCGLHVPWNLQVLPAGANNAKSNHMWPGHPHENHDFVGAFQPQQLRLKL